MARNGRNYSQMVKLVPGTVATKLDPFNVGLATDARKRAPLVNAPASCDNRGVPPFRHARVPRCMLQSTFDPIIAEWFAARFGAPTEPQLAGWPEIRAGRDVLISAPT